MVSNSLIDSPMQEGDPSEDQQHPPPVHGPQPDPVERQRTPFARPSAHLEIGHVGAEPR